jgi:C4-dicarboxylate-specific signal transduction histidine kinase
LQGRQSYFYGVGLTTGQPGFFISEPVRSGDEVIGVMVVKVSLDTLEHSWADRDAPVVLQDSRGIVFLSSEREWLYRSRAPLTADDLAWLGKNSQYGERTGYDVLQWRVLRTTDSPAYQLDAVVKGQSRSLLALESVLPELGWTLVVTSDLKGVTQARREAMALAALLAAVMLLAGLYW